MNDLTHIDLFSGIGGFALAAGWAGFRTIAFCEIEPFCQEVLKARFGAVADAASVRRNGNDAQGKRIQRPNKTRGEIRASHRPTLIPDIFAFDGTRFRGATLLTGGFPCQPFSHAGKRRGKEDNRYLWPQMLRVISEARPAWVIGENVSGLKSMVNFSRLLEMDTRKYTQDEMASGCFDVGQTEEREGRGILDEIVASLEEIGYDVTPIFLPAISRQAPHERQRVWIVAHSDGRRNAQPGLLDPSLSPESDSQSRPPQNPVLGGDGGRGDGDTPRMRRALQTQGPDSDAPDAESGKAQPAESGGFHAESGGQDSNARDSNGGQLPRLSDGGIQGGQNPDSIGSSWDIPWIEVATRFCRVDDGLPAWVHARRVARLKALGNSIVPQVAHEIIKVIAEIERMTP